MVKLYFEGVIASPDTLIRAKQSEFERLLRHSEAEFLAMTYKNDPKK